MFEWRPSAQGSGADAPSLQKCPGVQLSHSVAPKALWCLPAGHLVQSACPVSALNVPGSQNAHEALLFTPTAALAFPTPQWRHASLELLPIKALMSPLAAVAHSSAHASRSTWRTRTGWSNGALTHGVRPPPHLLASLQ
eukprot:7379212-Prymnesium_polylepis.1